MCHDSDWIPVLKESSYASETVEAGEGAISIPSGCYSRIYSFVSVTESLETEAEDITLADYVSVIHGMDVPLVISPTQG